LNSQDVEKLVVNGSIESGAKKLKEEGGGGGIRIIIYMKQTSREY
jgi:hypothetical protein